jgi:hypothetical protein
MNNIKNINRHWINILLFAIGILLLNSWAVNIFGGHIKNLIWTNIILAIAGIAGFMIKLFPENEQLQFKQMFSSLFMIFISKKFLIIFYAVLLVISSFFTSITLKSSDDAQEVKALVAARSIEGSENFKSINKNNNPARFFRFSHPFGRKFHVEAEGYSKTTVKVYPWLGKKLALDEDLRPSTTLWIRLPTTLVNTLLDQCALVICNENDTLYNVKTELGKGSLVIGRKLSVSEERLSSWTMEASTFIDANEPSLVNNILFGWQSIRHINPEHELGREDELKIFLNHASGMTLAQAIVTGADKPVIDVLLKRN